MAQALTSPLPRNAGPVPGNTIGRMTGLSLYTPVRPAWVRPLRVVLWLAKYFPKLNKRLVVVGRIAFMRTAVLKKTMPNVGDPKDHTKLNYNYIFFEAHFDQSWQNYIDAFAYVIPQVIGFVWGRGFHFPKPPPAEPLKAWIARNSMEGGHYYAAYPEASPEIVRDALRVRTGLEALKAEGRGLSPAEFKTAYDRFLTTYQRSL